MSVESEGVVVLYESDDEADDCKSSKLVWVVGVHRDEVGESGVKNCGISVNSSARSIELSWTKEVKKSLLSRSNKVVGGDEVDIKAAGSIAGADGPGVSAFIVRLRGGVGVYLQGISGVCVERRNNGLRVLKIVRTLFYFGRQNSDKPPERQYLRFTQNDAISPRILPSVNVVSNMTVTSAEETTPREISIMRFLVPKRKVSEPTKNIKCEGKQKRGTGSAYNSIF